MFIKSTLTPPNGAEKCPSTLVPPEKGTRNGRQGIPRFRDFDVLTDWNPVIVTDLGNPGDLLGRAGENNCNWKRIDVGTRPFRVSMRLQNLVIYADAVLAEEVTNIVDSLCS